MSVSTFLKELDMLKRRSDRLGVRFCSIEWDGNHVLCEISVRRRRFDPWRLRARMLATAGGVLLTRMIRDARASGADGPYLCRLAASILVEILDSHKECPCRKP